MSRPRFQRLPEAKRSRILEAAAKEFSACGFENASLNRVLEEAGISKGAAYYYFDDKADLYNTTLQHYLQELLAGLSFDPGQLNASNFWSEVATLYLNQFTQYCERPWVLGMAKSAAPVSMEALAGEGMAGLWESAQGLLGQLVDRGQELGVIRDDLPDDLLQSLLVAVDVAHDQWLFARWDGMRPAEIKRAADQIADLLRRLLEPRAAKA